MSVEGKSVVGSAGELLAEAAEKVKVKGVDLFHRLVQLPREGGYIDPVEVVGIMYQDAKTVPGSDKSMPPYVKVVTQNGRHDRLIICGSLEEAKEIAKACYLAVQ